MIEREGRFEIAGLIGLAHEVGTRLLGYVVLGTEQDLSGTLSEYGNAIVTVGQIKTPDLRIRLFELLRDRGCTLPAVVSPRAYVSSHAFLGEGSIVMHGAVVNAGAAIGCNCIINSQALIEHDAVVADHCHISTAAVINGGVRVGTATFIGSNSTVRQDAVVGERCVIGMGQRVLSDCPSGTWLPPVKSRT